jgi:AcrR family transcriptional regulator
VTTRRYRLGRRADAAAATRRRIVEATLELHDEQGISATSVRDVASRASVAPSTVLHHFPVMDSLIEACGELSDQLAPMPTDAILAGARTERERIGRLASALFEWWEQLGPGFDHLRTDRRRIPAVDDWMTDLAGRHRQLATAALDRADPSRADLLVALTTPDAWRALRDAGLDPRRAGLRVARLIGRDRDPMEDLH